MTIRELLNKWQKEYLSPFCLNACEDSCCTRAWQYVVMNSRQVRKVYGIPENEEVTIRRGCVMAVLEGEDIYHVLTCPSEKQPHCPGYDPITKLCRIQDDKPQICKDYPLKIKVDFIRLNKKCGVAKSANPVLQELIRIAKAEKYMLYVGEDRVA